MLFNNGDQVDISGRVIQVFCTVNEKRVNRKITQN